MRLYAPISAGDPPSAIARIEACEPYLKALVTPPNPAAGRCVAVKDIVHVDGMPARAGSRVPVEPQPQAGVVTALISAGWSVLAKSATTEFACFEPAPTTNPCDTACTPGGSSSGSAAAVAAGYCHAAIGTQTVGSIVRPAAYCGVAGFKPAYGEIGMDGIELVAPSLDTIGWFAADVAGLAEVADALLPSFAPAISSEPRLAIAGGRYLEQADETSLPDVPTIEVFDDIERVNHLHRTLMFAEFARVHRDRFERFAGLYRPGTLACITTGLAADDTTAQAARAGRRDVREHVIAVMDRHRLDALIAPAATGRAPRGLRTTGDGRMSLPWTYAGLPVATVPIPQSGDLPPLGVQVIARTDAEVLGIAAYVERHCYN